MNALRTAPLIALLFAGCHGSVEVYKPTLPVYSESEPNDDVFYANDFGYVHPGDQIVIAGEVSDDGYDPQDGFAFTAAGPVAVEFTLDAFCECADLDVWLYDPVRDEFAAVFESPHDPEWGQFSVYSQDFHLVVVSAGGHSDYRLDVRVGGFYGQLDGSATGEALAPVGLQVAPEHAVDLGRAPQGYRREPSRRAAPDIVEVFRIDERTGEVESVLLMAPMRED